jgi:hypothetical protein
MRCLSGSSAIACVVLTGIVWCNPAIAHGVEHILQGSISVRDVGNVWGGRTARCTATLNVTDYKGDAGSGTIYGPTGFGTFAMPPSNSGDPSVRQGRSPGAATFYADKFCHIGDHVGATLQAFSCEFVGTNGKGDESPQNKIQGTPNPNADLPKGSPPQTQPGDTHWVDPQTPPKITDLPSDPNFDSPKRAGIIKRVAGKVSRWGDDTVTIVMFWSKRKCELPPTPDNTNKKKETDEPPPPGNDAPPVVKPVDGPTTPPTTQEKPSTGDDGDNPPPKKKSRGALEDILGHVTIGVGVGGGHDNHTDHGHSTNPSPSDTTPPSNDSAPPPHD